MYNYITCPYVKSYTQYKNVFSNRLPEKLLVEEIEFKQNTVLSKKKKKPVFEDISVLMCIDAWEERRRQTGKYNNCPKLVSEYLNQDNKVYHS